MKENDLDQVHVFSLNFIDKVNVAAWISVVLFMVNVVFGGVYYNHSTAPSSDTLTLTVSLPTTNILLTYL